jgi:branched-chain amino acid transport system substrate-binding protein
MGTGDITDEPYLDAVGDAALGVLTTGMYSTQHNSPMNKEFVKDYLAQNGAKARIGWSVIAAWDALRLVYDGLEAQKGSKFDPDKFMSFVHGRTFESPRGEMTIDKATGDVVQNIYIRRAEKVDGVIQNVEIETLPKLGFK